ncbi:uncharacterized protein SCHCODRAFT_02661576 [Schizophyllum commune H4-8]|uniref:Tc1-like transposase DDE domain-containing protein n=1 Tax=Schizophyllum commune (strain H4-8 / FGSC 9210) TaxID=578458 RepID=D8PWC0_SCHCM|nr:uncharacterized protein SCHCODRAFT_02661576 [Schizophyllum commune H4-8]KAI5900010.1 hypothetical protein SCHCODRAFT_02661576 [Schizophyllum commune H4-8]
MSNRSLSARKMPANPWKAGKNFMVEVNKLNNDGNQVYLSMGKYMKEKRHMEDGWFINSDGAHITQSLYYADPATPSGKGQFKGMKQLLRERGINVEGKLAECKNFKCAEGATMCCCRRLLYLQPDFTSVKSLLEITCEAQGVEVLFPPKFHCELNPIEMCWGYAKGVYQLNPESSREDALGKNALAALDAVPLESIRRYTMRTCRFASAYAVFGLNGKQAAWAAKKYRGHRSLSTYTLFWNFWDY